MDRDPAVAADRPGAWAVDYQFPPPEPAPVTTIAWRLSHLIVGVFSMRAGSHHGAEVSLLRDLYLRR